MKDNNLFRYATSELSQDAFICWLVSHCKADIYEENSPLCQCAVKFLNEMLPDDKKWREGVEIQIKRQFEHIDVLIIVDDIYIILEDKTYTDLHDNQVNGYITTLVTEYEIPEEKICTVFYKTGGNKKSYEKFDCTLLRKDLLKLFRPYHNLVNDSIFNDYVEYLEDLESYGYQWISLFSSNFQYRYALGDRKKRPLFCMYTHPGNGRPEDSKRPWGGARSIALELLDEKGKKKYDSLIMINICSFCCSDNKNLPDTLDQDQQKRNLEALSQIFSEIDTHIDVWAVWGNSIEKKAYYKQALAEMVDKFPEINWYTIGGTTQNGHPHHYQGIPKKTEMEVFDVKKYLQTLKG